MDRGTCGSGRDDDDRNGEVSVENVGMSLKNGDLFPRIGWPRSVAAVGSVKLHFVLRQIWMGNNEHFSTPPLFSTVSRQYYPVGIPVLFLSLLWANKVSKRADSGGTGSVWDGVVTIWRGAEIV